VAARCCPRRSGRPRPPVAAPARPGPYSPLTTSNSSTSWRSVHRTIGGRGRRPRRLRRVAARPSPRFQVPPLVEIAAPGRVVPGQPGGAAVRGAGAGVAKAPGQRLGVRAAAPALLQHRHAWSVPTAEQAKPGRPCHAQGRQQAGCRRGRARHAQGDRPTRLTGLPTMVGPPCAGTMRPRTRPQSAVGTWLRSPLRRFVPSSRKRVNQRVGPSRSARMRPALGSELRWPGVGNWRRTRPSDQVA
jgi:hypothetical protein